ncbi:MAG TPA: class I SAM-dependent methyltransferase [Solirubrobacteraceae bacterium]|nr:class I SAM-dependent methyltransferase [Solirubrobacteraceae bacterium]
MRLPRPGSPRLVLRGLLGGELWPGGRFATGAPSPQTAIDAIPGSWASRLPLPGVSAGQAELFADPRVEWAIAELGGVSGASCLELGPLEGGHSYMLEQAGAGRVVAVEANREAYLKCLVVKELLGLQRCSFLCGDAIDYLEATDDRFEVCWCAGILYHMVEPVRLIDLVSRRASRLYMWTHYYDAARLPTDQPKGRPFANGRVTEAVHQGYRHELHRHEYGAATRLRGFWGGTQPHSNWLTLEGLLGALEHFGWGEIRTQLDDQHPHGPAVNLVAVRL